MSGLRWTSTIGNAWNSVITGLALKVLSSWGIPVDQIERFIRGDDSAIFVPNWATGACMNIAYDAIGAIAGQGKFSLQDHQIEFLRVWYSDHCSGYPNRAIPGLTQRKPWSSNPWSEDMVLRALYEAIRTLRRRVTGSERTLDVVWTTLRRIWCQDHNLPVAVAWTPSFAGGFGIESPPPGQLWRIEPPVPRVSQMRQMRVLNQTTRRANSLKEYALSRYNIDISHISEELAHQELLDTIRADNVPTVSSVIRQSWLHQVRRTRCRAVRKYTRILLPALPIDFDVYAPDRVSTLLSHLRSHAPLFSIYPEISVARVDYTRFQPKVSFTEWLRKYYPRVFVALGKFHRSWHLSEKLDYLAGEIVIIPKIIHPALVKVLSWAVACVCLPSEKAVRCSTIWAGTILERVVANSPLSSRVYWW
jgi:hypothetical protein